MDDRAGPVAQGRWRGRGAGLVAAGAVAAVIGLVAVLTYGDSGRRPSDVSDGPDGPRSAAPAAVEGTWKVETLRDRAGEPLPAPSKGERPATVTLHAGLLSGYNGCNWLFGTYRRSGAGGLLVPADDLRLTARGCRDIGPRLDDRLLAVRSAAVDGDRLTLRSGTGAVVATLTRRPSSLSEAEYDAALRAAREQLRGQQATVIRATAVAVPGTVRRPTTGTPCTSGRLLRVTLVGTFPRILISPTPGGSSTVRTVVVTADAATGRACLVGARTTRPPAVAGETRLDLPAYAP